MPLQINHPFAVDGHGDVATADNTAHVDQLLMQVLFTSPGERVNRPDFGVGLRRAVFEDNTAESGAALRFLIEAEIERWLGDRLVLESVSVESDANAGRLEVVIAYRNLGATTVTTRRFSA